MGRWSDDGKTYIDHTVEEQGAIGWEDDGTPQGNIATTQKENAFMRNARLGNIKRGYAVLQAQAIGTYNSVLSFTIPAGKKGYVISLMWSVKAANATAWLSDGTNTIVGGYIGSSGPKSYERKYDGVWELLPGTYSFRLTTDAVSDFAAEYVYLEK